MRLSEIGKVPKESLKMNHGKRFRLYRAAEIVKHPASGVVFPAERVTDDGEIHA